MPSTMISLPGRPFGPASTSGDGSGATESEMDAEGALSPLRMCLDWPRIHDRRSQDNMAVAAFKGSRLRFTATVPHQGIGQRDACRDLFDDLLVGGTQQ